MTQTQFFNEICKAFDLRIRYKDDTVVLCNPRNSAFIEISQEEYYTDSKKTESFSEYTVCFSTQHRHFASLKDVEEYIRLIVSDEVLPIEFFDSNRARFGGELRKDDLNGITVQSLAQKFGYTVEYISQFDFEVHSWSGKNDIKRTKVSEISNSY